MFCAWQGHRAQLSAQLRAIDHTSNNMAWSYRAKRLVFHNRRVSRKRSVSHALQCQAVMSEAVAAVGGAEAVSKDAIMPLFERLGALHQVRDCFGIVPCCWWLLSSMQ
jgi:hypothetical protein